MMISRHLPRNRPTVIKTDPYVECRRNCISTDKCDYMDVGCAVDEDCMDGLGCGMFDDKPQCMDINECDLDPDICNGQPGTVCLNLISTYRSGTQRLSGHIRGAAEDDIQNPPLILDGKMLSNPA